MYDIVFLSYNEPKADQNWELLKARFRRATRVDGVSPIVAAHKAAAKRCRTTYFWVVDADNIIEPDFDFSFRWHRDDHLKDRVAVWRARNSINGLTYGYGGIKLLPRKAVLEVPDDVVDFTTSISDHFHVMEEVASVTDIDTTPYDAWRAGFREAAKLASSVIARHNHNESVNRLRVWCTEGEGQYADEARRGANAGRDYAASGQDLGKLNDWNWLRAEYEKTEHPSV